MHTSHQASLHSIGAGRMRKSRTVIILFYLVAVCTGVNAQTRLQLDDVRKEIERLEADLEAKADREKSLLEQAEDVDRKIGLQKTLLKGLEQERRSQETRIAEIERSLRDTRKRFERLKTIVSRRIVSLYKRGKGSDWEALLSMKSVNQTLVWLKYQRRIVENDRRNLRLLEEKQRSIETQSRRLREELREKEALIAEQQNETEKLEGQKRTQVGLLQRMRDDMTALREQIDAKQKVFSEIKGRISREEERRRAAPRPGSPSAFPSLKGKLDWPVRGSIVQKYGLQRDPVFKTETNNIGVVIRGKAGDNVYAVSDGSVYWVTWQRGEGNLIILDHNGYYTVYGRLEVVQVNQDDVVKRGDILGTIGDDSSLYGPLLSFSVWNGRDAENPENWLQ